MRDKTKATCPTCQSPFKDERWCAVWKDSGANKQEPHELVSAGLCAACTDSWHEGASQAEAPATWCCDGNGSSYGHAPTCRYSQPDYAQSAIPEAPPCHCDPGDGLYPGGFEADCPVHGGVGAAEAPKPDLANTMREMADRSYCDALDYAKRDECLGYEQKLKVGEFGKKELDAHKRVAEMIGRHRGMSPACEPQSVGSSTERKDECGRAAFSCVGSDRPAPRP